LEKFKDTFGYRPIAEVINENNPKREYVDLKDLSNDLIGQSIWIRGRVFGKQAISGKFGFITLRSKYHTLQCKANIDGGQPIELVKFALKVHNEAVIDLFGAIVKSEVEVTGCYYKHIEFDIHKCYVVSNALPQLPVQMEDLMRPTPILDEQQKKIDEISSQIEKTEEKLKGAKTDQEKEELNKVLENLKVLKSEATVYPTVEQNLRLDYRVIDLRTPANHAIYTISSAFCSFFRLELTKEKFIEIHTPKLIGSKSEGGAEVFEVGYFGRLAYLAQSPQFYKQMCVVGDFGRVFEIGPVFRAEKSDTHRHLTEFVGVDLEMEFNQHYHEVLIFIGRLLGRIFKLIEENFETELQIINEQYPFERIKFPEEPLIFKFSEIVSLINENGGVQKDLEDLNTENEKLLGRIIKKKYNTDFYIVDKFPFNVRAFYTMPDPEDPRYGNAYDIFLRGEEISSGAQRQHDSKLLEQQVLDRGIDPEFMRGYIDCFSYGSSPHAGCGLGLERIVNFYLNLGNVRKTSLFPRDMYRIFP